MTVLDYENSDAATEPRTIADSSQATQSNPVTRRVLFELVSSELETRAIERNNEFYTTLMERIAVDNPQLVDADDVM